MSAINLAGVGWVPNKPVGNRLRWSWSSDATDGNVHLVPQRLFIERARLDIGVSKDAELLGPAAGVPSQLWKHFGDISISGSAPIQMSLGTEVQAVRFLYQGPPGQARAFHGNRCVLNQALATGQSVLLQASWMDSLSFMVPASAVQLQQFSTLDLYAPNSLKFERIAEIDVAATATCSFGEAARRYPAAPTLSAAGWAELQTLWTTARTEPLSAVGPNGINAWQTLQLVLGTRWEYAVLCGLGFVDGPHGEPPVLDKWKSLLPGPEGVAYRVLDADQRLEQSNIICVPGAMAPNLPVVPAPTIQDGAIRLRTATAIGASWDLVWTSPSPAVIGVLVTETIVDDTVWSTSEYSGRGGVPGTPPDPGIVHREADVRSGQVSVSASLRAEDGFDRVGPPGPACPLTPLAIDHHPQAPPLRSATNDGLKVRLTQFPPATWSPDILVASFNATVRFYRRIANPVQLKTTVDTAVPAENAVVLTLNGPAPSNPAVFIGGQATVGAAKGTVVSVTWPAVTVDLPPTSWAVLPGDLASLSQSSTDLVLFIQVHEIPAHGVPEVIAFPDSIPPTNTARIDEYRAQVAFGGFIGPLGGAVQAFWLPATPNVPPPFSVTTLGVDFYNRTLVQLQLTSASSDKLEVWWADGEVSTADFSHHAVPGDAGTRFAEGGTILFDTLSLPVPKKVPRTVTFGVQAVNGADGRSQFMTVVHTLPQAP